MKTGEKESEPLYPVTPWITGFIHTSAGDIPAVKTKLNPDDKIGSFKVRLGIGRMNYWVEPGLYAVGSPTPDSPVMVSANYKLSFDHLRSSLNGYDAWIMVLNTFGINVWCAAGKGTFGTDEILNRIKAVRLSDVVSHKNLVLPQLSAPGVSAHIVKRASGFRVNYGPVRAEDLPFYLDNGMKTTPEMRRVRFNIRDRAVLIPLELVMSFKYTAAIVFMFALLSGLGREGFSLELLISYGPLNGVLFLSTFLAGTVFIPLLLPWLPGKAFSIKGFWLGVFFASGIGLFSLYFPCVF